MTESEEEQSHIITAPGVVLNRAGVMERYSLLAGWDHPELSQPCRPVPEEGWDNIVHQTLTWMHHVFWPLFTSGDMLSLAANQLGHDVRIILLGLDRTQAPDEVTVAHMVNPEIIARHQMATRAERCAAFNGAACEPMPRAQRITVAFQDADGVAHETELVDDAAIRCQHTIDHLDGRLLPQHLAETKRHRDMERTFGA